MTMNALDLGSGLKFRDMSCVGCTGKGRCDFPMERDLFHRGILHVLIWADRSSA